MKQNGKHFNKHIWHTGMDSRFLTTHTCVPMSQLHRIIRYANNKIRYILAHGHNLCY